MFKIQSTSANIYVLNKRQACSGQYDIHPIPNGGMWAWLQEQMKVKQKQAQKVWKHVQYLVMSSAANLPKAEIGQSDSKSKK